MSSTDYIMATLFSTNLTLEKSALLISLDFTKYLTPLRIFRENVAPKNEQNSTQNFIIKFVSPWQKNIHLTVALLWCVQYILGICHLRSHADGHRLLASYQLRNIVGCACAGNAGNVLPATDLKGNRKLAIPACITARASSCAVMHVAIANPRWRGNRSRRMHNPQL